MRVRRSRGVVRMVERRVVRCCIVGVGTVSVGGSYRLRGCIYANGSNKVYVEVN
jgi:hypothetical protein